MFLDSNIFINASISSGHHGQASRDLLKRIAKGEQNAAISPLVMDEVIYVLIPEKGLDFAIKFLKTILANQRIQVLPVDERVLNQLPSYLEQGLEPRDAMHAATMQVYSISTICSYDTGFDNKKGIRRQEPK